MKVARLFAVIFGICGGILMLAAIVLCLTNLNAQVRLEDIPQEASQCAQDMMNHIGSGDFAAASGYIYGQPDLGAGREPATAEGKAVWEAYKRSISWQFQGDFHVTSRGLTRKVSLQTLDIPSLTGKVAGYAAELMNEKVAAATQMEDLYDENNNFRSDLVDGVLQEALEKALKDGGNTISCNTELEVVFRDGRWWVLPDQTLLNALQGGLT